MKLFVKKNSRSSQIRANHRINRKRRIVASLSIDKIEEFESFLLDGNTFSQRDIQDGLDVLKQIEDGFYENDAEDFSDGDYEYESLQDAIDGYIFENEDWNVDAAVTAITIAQACNRNVNNIRILRVSQEGDFDAVTFTDGITKYYFDRGALHQGIKDAETGKLYFYEGY